MYPDLLKTNWLPVYNPDDQRLTLGAESRMNPCFPSRESGNSKSAPDAGSPPTLAGSLNPVRRWGGRKRVNQPGITHVGVQDKPVNLRQIKKESLNLGKRDIELFGQFESVRATTGIDKSAYEFVMNARSRDFSRCFHCSHINLLIPPTFCA
jgi:hypothetical protein